MTYYTTTEYDAKSGGDAMVTTTRHVSNESEKEISDDEKILEVDTIAAKAVLRYRRAILRTDGLYRRKGAADGEYKEAALSEVAARIARDKAEKTASRVWLAARGERGGATG